MSIVSIKLNIDMQAAHEELVKSLRHEIDSRDEYNRRLRRQLNLFGVPEPEPVTTATTNAAETSKPGQLTRPEGGGGSGVGGGGGGEVESRLPQEASFEMLPPLPQRQLADRTGALGRLSGHEATKSGRTLSSRVYLDTAAPTPSGPSSRANTRPGTPSAPPPDLLRVDVWRREGDSGDQGDSSWGDERGRYDEGDGRGEGGDAHVSVAKERSAEPIESQVGDAFEARGQAKVNGCLEQLEALVTRDKATMAAHNILLFKRVEVFFLVGIFMFIFCSVLLSDLLF